VAAAYRSGLTPEGLTVLVRELSKGEAEFPYQLPDKTLARLAKFGVSRETADRCNELARQQAAESTPAAAAEPEPADTVTVLDHDGDPLEVPASPAGEDPDDDPDDLWGLGPDDDSGDSD